MTFILDNEAGRISELRRLSILDTGAEACYDEFTRKAAQLCGTPIALISLIDEDRQWFKSHFGLRTRETSRESSFCSHAIRANAPFLVEDAAMDARFESNPMVTGDPNIRFYAGAPLVTLGGYALGTLCVIDTVPRKLTALQIDQLKLLANEVIYMLELRAPL